jgi:hypothetical protein
MAIVSLDPEKVLEYIPLSERGVENPCIIGITFVPYAKVKEYSRMIAEQSQNSLQDARKVMSAGLIVQKKQFCEHVKYVKNYTGPDGEEVKTAAELYECADSELIMELLKAMESTEKLSEGQRKNS